MAALLDNGSVVHYKDAVRVPNGGEAMRDDDADPAPHQRLHGLLYLQFGAGVSTGSGLVQNQNGRIRQNRLSDGQQLLMCADSGYASLIQNTQGREQKEQVHLSDRFRQGARRRHHEVVGRGRGAFGSLAAEEQDVFLPLFRKYADALGVFIGNITKRRSASA